jgi:hypothetical protein
VEVSSIIGPAMMVNCPRLPFQTPAAARAALVLGKHRRGDGGRKNNGSTKHCHFSHRFSPLLREANRPSEDVFRVVKQT